MSLEAKGAIRKMDLGLTDDNSTTEEFTVPEGEGDLTFVLKNPAEDGGVTLFLGKKKFRKFSFDSEQNAVVIPELRSEAGETIRAEYEPPPPEYFGARNLDDLPKQHLMG